MHQSITWQNLCLKLHGDKRNWNERERAPGPTNVKHYFKKIGAIHTTSSHASIRNCKYFLEIYYTLYHAVHGKLYLLPLSSRENFQLLHIMYATACIPISLVHISLVTIQKGCLRLSHSLFNPRSIMHMLQ